MYQGRQIEKNRIITIQYYQKAAAKQGNDLNIYIIQKFTRTLVYVFTICWNTRNKTQLS